MREAAVFPACQRSVLVSDDSHAERPGRPDDTQLVSFLFVLYWCFDYMYGFCQVCFTQCSFLC